MNNKGTKYGIILLLIILALTGANLLFGSVNIPAEAVWHILTGNEVEKASWSFIVWESRLPQAITALLCGMALAASGLMLQTTFNNPLADPSIPVSYTHLTCARQQRPHRKNKPAKIKFKCFIYYISVSYTHLVNWALQQMPGIMESREKNDSVQKPM